MNTEKSLPRPRRLRAAALVCAALALPASAIWAQPADKTQPPPLPADKGQPPLSSPIGGGPPVGVGPGYHDPRSAFKPLQEREGVVSWKLLSSVVAKIEKDKVVPTFPPAVRALHAKPVKVQGFMLPLEPGERQRHFLLSAVPTTCNFCVPAGPEGLVEVRTREPVRYTVEAITVEGRFAVLNDDKFGLFYRVADAALAP